MLLPALAPAANVTINGTNNLATVGQSAYGMGTAVYDNTWLDATLPGRVMQSGVNTVRYPGGGYADVYHWSVGKDTGFFAGTGSTTNQGYVANGSDFGHFVQFLDNAQCQAVVTVDYGSGQQWNAGHTLLAAPPTNAEPQEAAAWVAYANGDASLYGTVNDIAIGTDSLGNDWKTVGFWAKLRSSTVAQYNAWAGTANHLTDYNFLAINHPTPAGIKYWEIGNEVFGDGYYGGGNGYSVNYNIPYDGITSRSGKASLSPAFYGQKVNTFAQAMKAVDPTIKIGVVVSTPPGDYSWDSRSGQHWIPQVLLQCASNTDFVIAHWYPTITGGTNYGDFIGSNLLAGVGTTIPFMIEGATAGQDSSTSSGLRDWINAARPTDGTNVQIFITEFGYMGTPTNSIVGALNELFCADSYATWMDFGVANIDWLELMKTTYLGDSNGNLQRGAAYYAIQMVHYMAGIGDKLVGTTSDTSTVRAHAALQQNGKLGLLLLNEDPNNSQTIFVNITNAAIANSGTLIQFGAGNFASGQVVPSTQPTTNTVSGLGNFFSVTLPPYTMAVLTVPTLTNTPPVLAAIGNQTVNVGQTVAFTASAADTNQPPQALTFSLSSAPTNDTLTQINNTNAAFNWRPLATQANTTNVITLKVADSGTPSLSATQSFTVTVNPLTPPSVSSSTWNNGQFNLQVSGQAGPDYAVQVSTNLADWSTLWITNSPTMPFQWTDTNAGAPPMQFYRIKVGPPLP